MEVILKQDIVGIGKANAVVKVKDGFARNFLIPNNLAVPLNSVNLKNMEAEKQKKSLQAQKVRKEAEALKEKLMNFSLTIPVLAQDDEKLYGSIGPQELAGALKEEGLQVDKDWILLDEPIKSLGIYEVPLKLHPEVSVKIKVWIVKK
ncbi:MAG: 50S ribosomal protein L9 [Candidatus Omnitrophica bacterium]|nr:50S ribosomal protein L9 [Candidatus Omnitrophota bacterium]